MAEASGYDVNGFAFSNEGDWNAARPDGMNFIYSHASDVIEDAMLLAQVKSFNSFNYRDCINNLNEIWSYVYDRMSVIDEGYYSIRQKLTQRITHIPAFVRNTVRVYYQPNENFNRRVFRPAGQQDLNSSGTYMLSGFDLYCWDADHIDGIYLEYVPEPPFLTFTKNNRDPLVHEPKVDPVVVVENESAEFDGDIRWVVSAPLVGQIDAAWIQEHGKWQCSTKDLMPSSDNYDSKLNKYGVHQLHYMEDTTKRWNYVSQIMAGDDYNKTDVIEKTSMIPDPDNPGTEMNRYIVETVIHDYPYIFVSYYDRVLDTHESWILKDLLRDYFGKNRYNPFDFQGRPSNVQFIKAKFNDYTGMGVTIRDWNDMHEHTATVTYTYKETAGGPDKTGTATVTGETPTIKELGWTKDTLVTYPSRIMYNYMVAQMAKRFADLNSSTIMAVESSLIGSNNDLANFLKRDKAGFTKMQRNIPITVGDIL